jgi:hypothetical protein
MLPSVTEFKKSPSLCTCDFQPGAQAPGTRGEQPATRPEAFLSPAFRLRRRAPAARGNLGSSSWLIGTSNSAGILVRPTIKVNQLPLMAQPRSQCTGLQLKYTIRARSDRAPGRSSRNARSIRQMNYGFLTFFRCPHPRLRVADVGRSAVRPRRLAMDRRMRQPMDEPSFRPKAARWVRFQLVKSQINGKFRSNFNYCLML